MFLAKAGLISYIGRLNDYQVDAMTDLHAALRIFLAFVQETRDRASMARLMPCSRAVYDALAGDLYRRLDVTQDNALGICWGIFSLGDIRYAWPDRLRSRHGLLARITDLLSFANSTHYSTASPTAGLEDHATDSEAIQWQLWQAKLAGYTPSRITRRRKSALLALVQDVRMVSLPSTRLQKASWHAICTTSFLRWIIWCSTRHL